MANAFRYTHAVVSRIPKSFVKNAIGLSEPVDFALAQVQHKNYVKCLQSLNIDVIELPPDEEFPDSVFVEDTAVVCNGTALITRPGHPSRRKETETIKQILKKELELKIVEVEDEKATLDGGDVLFTGREFFVGLTERTNVLGALAVANAFPEYPCTPVKLKGALHLKSLVTMAGIDVLCTSIDQDAQEVIKRIEREASYNYHVLTLPDRDAANVIFANGTLLHRSRDEFPRSTKVFEEKVTGPRIEINSSETSKAQAALTCSSLLISLPKKFSGI
ncbi:N(G),N(G)-dimethylarginine dimethylaminohydrolase 1-like [Artemia franciscana]|uniref:N(G),N(G)-dimethylarginine dimethylaminohydrolase 1-like n=1 Tax=Artemia franciscana TaxID=6661 RepID=UPI0032DA0DBA